MVRRTGPNCMAVGAQLGPAAAELPGLDAENSLILARHWSAL
jgi:hypothetical protein